MFEKEPQGVLLIPVWPRRLAQLALATVSRCTSTLATQSKGTSNGNWRKRHKIR
jgi:hypothetical protein